MGIFSGLLIAKLAGGEDQPFGERTREFFENFRSHQKTIQTGVASRGRAPVSLHDEDRSREQRIQELRSEIAHLDLQIQNRSKALVTKPVTGGTITTPDSEEYEKIKVLRESRQLLLRELNELVPTLSTGV